MILRFHEDLQEFFPDQVQIEASTPLDALKLLAVQHPLNGKMKPIPVKIKQLKTFLEANDVTLNEEDRVFDIIPAELPPMSAGYAGAGGDNGLLNIVVGIVIVVVAIYAPYLLGAVATPGAAMAAGSFGAYAVSAGISMGVGLVLSGLMMLLAPTPKIDKDGNYTSRTFGARTTTDVGTPIQIVFGTHRVGFHLFSFNVDSRKYSGVDDPINSPYFKGKVDENMPTINTRKFYGFIQAGDKTVIKQVNNEYNRTGAEH